MARDTESDVVIGKALRFYRLEAGLSQARLGEMLDVTFQQIQKYEKGANRLSISRLLTTARALSFTPAQFFDTVARMTAGKSDGTIDDDTSHVTDERETARKQTQDYLFSDECLRFAHAASLIKDDSKRRALIALAETMAKSQITVR